MFLNQNWKFEHIWLFFDVFCFLSDFVFVQICKFFIQICSFNCFSMSDDFLTFLKFSMHCFKYIYIYFVCVNLLEHLIQGQEGSSNWRRPAELSLWEYQEMLLQPQYAYGMELVELISPNGPGRVVSKDLRKSKTTCFKSCHKIRPRCEPPLENEVSLGFQFDHILDNFDGNWIRNCLPN